MKKLILPFLLVTIALGTHVTATAQSHSLTETLKEHMNETNVHVKAAESADEKREILNESFDKMMKALDRIEARAQLSEDELAQLNSLKDDIQDRSNELNGLDGFDDVADADLDDFSEYSQQMMEQASRNITISLTTALLIVIILLLL